MTSERIDLTSEAAAVSVALLSQATLGTAAIMTLSQHWQQVGWQQEPRTNSKGGIYIKPPDARPGLNGGARRTVMKQEKERQKRHAVAAATAVANDNNNNTSS